MHELKSNDRYIEMRFKHPCSMCLSPLLCHTPMYQSIMFPLSLESSKDPESNLIFHQLYFSFQTLFVRCEITERGCDIMKSK